MNVTATDESGFFGDRRIPLMLFYIADYDGCMISELYRDVTGNRSRPDLLDALEGAGAGALERDRRVTRARLTDRGRRVAEQLRATEEIFDSRRHPYIARTCRLLHRY